MRIALAKSQTHMGLDVLSDRQDPVLPVHAHQVAHDGIRAELSGPRGTSSAVVIKPTSVPDSACDNA